MDLKLSFSEPSGIAQGQPKAWLYVSGPDSAAFLQGQCTQDVTRLTPTQTTHALWLNTKGRILGECLILRVEADKWWLWSAHTSGETLKTRLEDFIIADDVTVEDWSAEGWEQITFAGPVAAAWLRSALDQHPLPASGSWAPLGEGFLFPGRRGQSSVWEWLRPKRPASSASPFEPPTGLTVLSPDALKLSRLAAGVPAIPDEFGPQDLPQEAGLENVAISFNKGCYLGQEVMARIHAMGQVRRRLARITGPGSPPPAGTEIHQAGRRIGEIRAAISGPNDAWLGLGLVTLLGLDPSKPLATADGAFLELVDSPRNP